MVALIRVGIACCALAASGAEPSRQIDTARKLLQQVKYADAGKIIEETLARGSLDRGSLVELLAMQGIVQAALGAREKAVEAFSRLLELDPHYTLPDLAPKLKAPFNEARSRRGAEPPLAFSVEPAPGVLHAHIAGDRLGLAKAVRFHLRTGGAAFQTRDLPVDAAELRIPSVRTEWFVELLDAASDVLAQVGRADSPRVAEPAPDAALSEPVNAQPVATSNGPGLLPLGIGLAAAAVAAFGVGVGFGYASSSGRSAFDRAVADAGNGVISELTLAEATALSQNVPQQALIANALFITAGLLALAAIAVFIFR